MQRRRLLLTILATAACASGAHAQSEAQTPPVVTLFGDSIVAGYRLSPEDGMAHQLELALAAQGVAAVVRNAGVPGDTSAGGRARLAGSVRKDTAVCVVEFGGNDVDMHLTEATTRESLDAIVAALQARGVAVIVVENGGFGALQRRIAEAHGAIFFPDLFAGVGPDRRQADGDHPNAVGEQIIARRLAPVVAQALKSRAN